MRSPRYVAIYLRLSDRRYNQLYSLWKIQSKYIPNRTISRHVLSAGRCGQFCTLQHQRDREWARDVPRDAAIILPRLTFWHRSFTFNSNKSPAWCNNFSVYYPDVCLQLKMLQEFFRPSSGAQWLQWQPRVLPSYRGESRAVFVVGPAGRPDHEHSTTITTIRR